MRVILVAVLLFGTLLSCEGVEKVKLIKPSVLLSKDEMITVLIDVQQLESHYHNKFQRPNVYANALDSATQTIFERHKITKEVFKDNLTFYALNQDTLFSMYESALDAVNDQINSNFED